MPRRRISATSSGQALGVVKYIRVTLILFMAILALMVAGFWVFRPRILSFRFDRPAQLTVHYVDTAYELSGKATQPGKKYLLVAIRITGLRTIAYPIRPDWFELETSDQGRHRALPESPLFQEKGTRFELKEGDVFDGQLAFEVPEEAEGRHLRFPVR